MRAIATRWCVCTAIAYIPTLLSGCDRQASEPLAYVEQGSSLRIMPIVVAQPRDSAPVLGVPSGCQELSIVCSTVLDFDNSVYCIEAQSNGTLIILNARDASDSARLELTARLVQDPGHIAEKQDCALRVVLITEDGTQTTIVDTDSLAIPLNEWRSYSIPIAHAMHNVTPKALVIDALTCQGPNDSQSARVELREMYLRKP